MAISDRHIDASSARCENVKIVNSGDTAYLKGEIVNRFAFADANREIKEKGGKKRRPSPCCWASRRLQLASNSFVSRRASRNHARAEEAATTSNRYLKGLKENVIIGHMIPAGTGLQARDKLLELGALMPAVPEPENKI